MSGRLESLDAARELAAEDSSDDTLVLESTPQLAAVEGRLTSESKEVFKLLCKKNISQKAAAEALEWALTGKGRIPAMVSKGIRIDRQALQAYLELFPATKKTEQLVSNAQARMNKSILLRVNTELAAQANAEETSFNEITE